MLERLKITLLCILAAILYGELHDQITVRICLEYFTVFHPPIFHDTHNPTLLALGWGVIATWWVGFFLGLPLSICATVGKLPTLSARDLLKPITKMLLLLALLASLSGLTGYLLITHGYYHLPHDVTDFLPEDRYTAYTVAAFTHLASYAFGALLGITLCILTLLKRYELVATSKNARISVTESLR